MFKDSFIKAEEDFRLKAIVFPISLLIHAFIIMLFIAVPLSKTGQLPKIGSSGIIQAYIFSPTAPPAGNSNKPNHETKIKPMPTPTVSKFAGLMVPNCIPDKIIEEPLSNLGNDWGIPGGRTDSDAGLDLSSFSTGLFGKVFKDADDEVEVPVRPIGEIKAPRLIKHVDPLYPEIARQARVEGVVIIEATTDIYGRVQNIRIMRSIPLLDQAAIEAVRQWVYEPMVINGRPRGVIFTATVRFQLK